MTTMPARPRTVEEALVAADGRPSGFDYMRLTLSVAVFVMHSWGTSYGERGAELVWHGPAAPLVRAILPMFFAVSGFLVAASMERCATVLKFVGLRMIRVYPALICEVLIVALIVGPLLTRVPLDQYFSAASFWRYIANMTGLISHKLPGLYTDNPVPDYVDRQLWSLRFEFISYIILAAMMAIGAKQNRFIVAIAAFAVLMCYIAPWIHRTSYPFISSDTFTGQQLIIVFLTGATIYLYRAKIPFNITMFTISLLASATCLSGIFKLGYYFAIVPVSYVTVWLGLLNPRLIAPMRTGDYSYGIFLYGFAVQQTVMALLPWAREWYWNLAIGLPLTVLVAAASWHFVEKPASKLKTQVGALERWWLVQRAKLPWPNFRVEPAE